MNSRWWWRAGSAVLAVGCLASAAIAQTTSTGSGQAYPVKTVRVVIPTAPSGGSDMQGRLMCKRFTESMGQPFFADNRPGASGTIGADLVAKAPPDGYTLLVTSSQIAISAAIYQKLPFDVLKDLAPVGQIAAAPQLLLVHPSVPARSVRELVALARQRSGRLNAGSSGTGSVNYIAFEMLRQAAGINVVHVPYKSGSASATALMSGEVDLIFTGVVQAQPLLRSQRARPLAVTSANPSPVVPGVPTMASIYPGFISGNWYGMFAPAGTPTAIITRLNSEIVSALKAPEIRDFITHEGAEPIGSSPREFSAHLRSEIERYTKVARAANLKVE